MAKRATSGFAGLGNFLAANSGGGGGGGGARREELQIPNMSKAMKPKPAGGVGASVSKVMKPKPVKRPAPKSVGSGGSIPDRPAPKPRSNSTPAAPTKESSLRSMEKQLEKQRLAKATPRLPKGK